MRFLQTLFITVFSIGLSMAQTGKIQGKVVDENNRPIAFATVFVEETNKGTQTNAAGEYVIEANLGKQTIKIVSVGHKEIFKIVSVKDGVLTQDFIVPVLDNVLETIELYSTNNTNHRQVQNLTRLPLKIKDQLQSISIVSDAVIKEQGALTITDAARNVPGVIRFATYGGIRESMSIRGYRGTPVLINGVVLDSDFRTASGLVDMQGIKSVQVIKGSAAVGQGVGSGLGSAGGVINLTTKTPEFRNRVELDIRGGSWNAIRPTLDFEQILNKDKTLSLRVNAAYEKRNGFRINTKSEKFFVNPSLEWRPDDKTRLILEVDYLNLNATPDRGTINIDNDNVFKLFDMPRNKFLGFKEDNYKVNSLLYTARFERQLSEKLTFKITSVTADSKLEDESFWLSKVGKEPPFNIRDRTVSKSTKKEINSLVQVDLVGKEIETGFLKHTFQLGFDYKQNIVKTEFFDTYLDGVKIKAGRGVKNPVYIDRINVYEPISNDLPKGVSYKSSRKEKTFTPTVGFMAQDYVEITDYAKAIAGVRYSRINGSNKENATVDVLDPIFGVIVSPTDNINAFASYTTTTSLRGSERPLINGGFAGASKSKQIEFGLKTDWLDEKLGANFTYYFIDNDNLSNSYYEGGAKTNKYFLAGNLKRNGFEFEVTGKVTKDIDVILGYANLNARYTKSPSYVEGSAPMNAPKHTANGWLNYQVSEGSLSGLSVGAGAYYVGARPSNEYGKVSDGHGSDIGTRPFDMPEYTTVNAQLGYAFHGATVRVFFNNIFDSKGYTAYYRGGYINETDPRSFAVQLSYVF